MAQTLQHLCALLISDTLGHTCQQVFTVLAEQGRLSRQQLQRITRLPGRQLRHALAVLTQQHILRHHTDDAETSRYQVDWRNSYYLTRSNRIISLVEERYGEGAATIIANLLQLGHARVGDLVQAFDLEPASKRDSGIDACDEHVNGDAETNGAGTTHKTDGSKITTIGQFHHTLRLLLQAGFLVKISKRAYMPASDLQEEIEDIVISEHFPDRKVNGPKKQAEFRTAVNNLKRKWRDADEYSDRNDLDSRGTVRHAAASNAKRAKLNGFRPNGLGTHGDHDEHVVKLPNEMVLKVNYAQCTVAFRSERLEELAEKFLGGATATVYGALLRVIEAKLQARDDSLKVEDTTDDEDDDLPTATTMDVADILDSDLDLGLGIHDASEGQKLANGNISKGKTKSRIKSHDAYPELGIKEEYVDDDGLDGYTSYQDRHKRFALVEEHLKLLEEHPKGFCRRVGGGGRGEWRVPFSSLTDILVQADIDSMILARFGKVHTRIIRLLRERGRLEEKQVAALTMMRMKDVRAILTELQYAGIAESQEVPRDTSRMAARTSYLWFHDQSRVQNLLLQQTYQGMCRTLQRLRQERENFKTAIEKAEMMDVRQEALNANERVAVTQWREVEERLVVQVQRMDDLVALLRDFSGKDTTLVS